MHYVAKKKSISFEIKISHKYFCEIVQKMQKYSKKVSQSAKFIDRKKFYCTQIFLNTKVSNKIYCKIQTIPKIEQYLHQPAVKKMVVIIIIIAHLITCNTTNGSR